MLTGRDPRRPLDGALVLEAGPLLPAPAAGASLRALGAEVVRIEGPEGDPARVLYGGWLHELYGVGKRAVTLDLRAGAGRAELAALARDADVAIVGYRPAAARRLGLDAPTLMALNDALVHCAIVGFPSDGPDAQRPGHDLSFLARSGALAVPAGPSAVGAPPRRPAIPIADLAGAAYAVQAILAALLARQAGHGGRAIEIPLERVTLAWAAPRLGGALDARFGATLDPANDLYRCADDDWIAIAAIERRFWAPLARAIGLLTPLPEGAEAWESAERVRRADELAAILRDGFARRAAAAWVDELEAAGVPVERVVAPADVAARVGADLDHWRALATPLPFDAPPTDREDRA